MAKVGIYLKAGEILKCVLKFAIYKAYNVCPFHDVRRPVYKITLFFSHINFSSNSMFNSFWSNYPISMQFALKFFTLQGELKNIDKRQMQ